MGSTLKFLITCHMTFMLIISTTSFTGEIESSLCPYNKIIPKNNVYCPGSEGRANASTIELIGVLFEFMGESAQGLLMAGAITYSVQNVNR